MAVYTASTAVYVLFPRPCTRPCTCWERCAFFRPQIVPERYFRNYLNSIQQRAPPTNRRAAITLGIGPHFTWMYECLFDFIIVLHGFNLLPLMVRADWEGPLQLTVGPQIFSAFLGPQICTLTTVYNNIKLSLHKEYLIKSVTISWPIDREKWRHISVVAIRSPFCRSTPSYCVYTVKIYRVIRIKLNQLVQENVRISAILLRKWCPSKKRYAELDLQHGGKTAGIDMIWRNYATVTLCIHNGDSDVISSYIYARHDVAKCLILMHHFRSKIVIIRTFS